MIAGAFITVPLPWAFGSMTAWLLLSWRRSVHKL
jgi:hypothetical protein